MPVATTSRGRTPTVPITCQLPFQIGLDLEAAAEALGVSRHRLFRLAFEVGFPIVTAQIRTEPAAIAVQQPPIGPSSQEE